MTAAVFGGSLLGELVTYEVLDTAEAHLFWRREVRRIGQLELRPLCEESSFEQQTYPRERLTPLCRRGVSDCAGCWRLLGKMESGREAMLLGRKSSDSDGI